MLYTYALRRSPLKVLPGASQPHAHYFGGELVLSQLDESRFARLLTLDLRDPLLSFLRFPSTVTTLPLVMDFAEGYISYSLGLNGSDIDLHSPEATETESLLDEQLPIHPAHLEVISYEQYRAAALRSAVLDESYLSEADRTALRELGEEFTQLGGDLIRGSDYSPYCSNPACSGYGCQVTSPFVSISQAPAPGLWLGSLPNDPAIEFSLCQSCHSISGTVIVD
jgi:hypothetical protein